MLLSLNLIRKAKPIKRTGFYWQANKPNLQGFVEVLPLKITIINEHYHRIQSAKTRKLIGELFLQKNVPRLIKKAGKNHLILDNIYNEREAATLHLWGRLCAYPPTHSVIVGYVVNGKRHESVRLSVSLFCVGDRHPWAVQLIGLVIARLLNEAKSNYLLIPGKSNAEFWLQCIFAVVCSIREG